MNIFTDSSQVPTDSSDTGTSAAGALATGTSSKEPKVKRVPGILVNPFVIVGGSLSFIGGLAWNEAIQSGINTYFPKRDNNSSLRAKFIYALIITIFIALFALFLNYANEQAIRAEQKLEENAAAKKLALEYSLQKRLAKLSQNPTVKKWQIA